jgi:hypothetical protein
MQGEMNACYAVFVLVCCMQPAMFILCIALNKHLTCHVMHVKIVEASLTEDFLYPTGVVIAAGNISVDDGNNDLLWASLLFSNNRNNNNNNSNTTAAYSYQNMTHRSERVVIEWSAFNMDRSLGVCSGVVCGFGVLYLFVLRANREYCFLHHDDDESAMHLVDSGASETGVQSLELARFAFWAFVCIHGYMISMVGSSNSVREMEHMQIEIMCRLMGLWILCRTGRSIRGKGPIVLGGFLYFGWVYGMFATEIRQACLLIVQFFLDLLLFIGHRWDTRTSALVVLNCRLFYVASVSILLVCLVFTSSSSSS